MMSIENMLRAVALVGGLTLGGTASAGDLVYFHETNFGPPRELYDFDPSTGISTLRSTSAGPERWIALEERPSTGVIYAVDPAQSVLYTLDLDTAVPTLIGYTGLQSLTSLAFDPTTDVLYGLSRFHPYNLYVLDPATGSSWLIGNTGGTARMGLECDASGQLFAAEPNGVLWKLDKATAAATLVGGNGGMGLVEDAVFTSSGELYFTDLAGWIHKVDPATGFNVPIANTNLGIGLLGIVEDPGPPCAAPSLYCTPKVNSLGCTPAIGSSGQPSASASGGFVVHGTHVRNNKSGLLFYGTSGQASTLFQGGTLCVKAPIRRTPVTSSGGSTPPVNDCSGSYSIDMNAFAQGLAGGAPSPLLLVPGTVVNCQWWGRDPGFPPPNNTTLTDGLEYTICL